VLEAWRRQKEQGAPTFTWLRSLRPPSLPLGGPQRVYIPVDTGRFRFLNLRFSPGGERLLAWLNPVGVADLDRRVLRAWDARSGREVEEPDPREIPPQDPCRSPDGRWRVEFGGPEGGWGLPLRLLDAATGAQAAAFPIPDHLNLGSVAFSPRGERIIGGGWDEDGLGVVLVWNVASGARIAELAPHGSVFAIAVSFNRQFAATGGSDGTIQVWDLDTATQVAVVEGHEDGVQALAFSPDGQLLVSGAEDRTVRLWDVETGAEVACLTGHEAG
jgi:WD40 repeat protein